jgi:hypothetical protein
MDKDKLKKVAGELENASKMHAGQAKKIKSMLKYGKSAPFKMKGFTYPGAAPTKHLKSDDKVHMELWGDKHTNADHPDHWKEKKQDETGEHNISATKTEGTQEEQKLRKKRAGLKKKKGLWDNIHAKRKRIKAGSGEKMRKPGDPGAPSAKDLKDSQ